MRAPLADPTLVGTPWAGLDPSEFGSWGWQVKNRIETLAQLESIFDLTARERAGFDQATSIFRFAITPYYALLADRRNSDCPIRRQVVPLPDETIVAIGERGDPLGEEELEAAPNLIHRYPDRVLLLVTDRCPVYCRFCTRRRIVGRIERQASRGLLEEALDYVRDTPAIREVILSGGDGLMLGDNQLEYLLSQLRAIEHVDIIRIATRMPVTCPMRVTDDLVRVLGRHAPIYVMTHFNHEKECTASAFAACARLVDAGVVVYNQSVLLRGINDTSEAIAALNRRLVSMRVTPYYLHQCDMALGIEHFRTPLDIGIGIVEQLRGRISGLAAPQLCVDVPGGLGKVTLQPQWIVERQGRSVKFRTYTGETAEYVDPATATRLDVDSRPSES